MARTAPALTGTPQSGSNRKMGVDRPVRVTETGMLDERQQTFLVMTDQLLTRIELAIAAAHASKELLEREYGKQKKA